jgi:hypothetical protein
VPLLPWLWALSALPGVLSLTCILVLFSPFFLFSFSLSALAECGRLLVVFWLPFCNEVPFICEKEKEKEV